MQPTGEPDDIALFVGTSVTADESKSELDIEPQREDGAHMNWVFSSCASGDRWLHRALRLVDRESRAWDLSRDDLWRTFVKLRPRSSS